MTTVSRVNTVTNSSVTGGADWDHRLNRLLEDLQGTVTPPEGQANVSEYREYRTYSSSKTNDEPAHTTSEKWVEYGTQNPGGPGTTQRLPALSDSAFSSTREKTVNFSDDILESSRPAWGNDTLSSTTRNATQMEFLAPANTTTVLKSGPSSPIGGLSSTEGKVERKEFYAKSSYTSLIKGSGAPTDVPPAFETIDSRSDRLLEDFRSREPLPEIPRPSGLTSSSISESRRAHFSETTRGTTGVPDSAPIGPPLYSSTPLKSTQSSYTKEVINNRSVTPPPPPSEGLKTPPLVRKILQSSTGTHSHLKSSSSTTTTKTTDYDSTKPLCASRPPLSSSPGIPNYDEPPEPTTTGTRYYSATTTRTEHRENRELSPVRRFPSPQPPRGDYYGEPPKRLDELMATFEDSYTETRRITGDGGGPHRSHPYGPGTQPVEPVRRVQIDDTVTQRIITDEGPDLHQRKNATNYQNPSYQPKEVEPTRNVAGPPVFYPSNQVFPKTEEDAKQAQQEGGKGKMKSKRKAEWKAKEKMKSGQDEKSGQGAVPVPVCLPVCCAAPCTIM